MPRHLRHLPGGMLFHVLNRGVGRPALFHKDEDYAAFERVDFVNEPQTVEELKTLRRSANRGCPVGDEPWQKRVVEELSLQSTLRPRGRPSEVSTDPVPEDS